MTVMNSRGIKEALKQHEDEEPYAQPTKSIHGIFSTRVCVCESTPNLFSKLSY